LKNRKKPIRKMPLEKYNESLIILDDYPSLNYKHICNLSLLGQDDYRIAFDACIFENVNINQNKFLRAEFIDCTFTNCDLSNNSFTDSTFIRCEFLGCKFIGSHFVQTHLTSVLLEDCNLHYLDFAENKIKIVDIKNSFLKESIWFENEMDNITFVDNNLTEATFYNNPLKDLDLSTCIIDGIRTDKISIEGVSIDVYQAVVFCHLLGIRIKT